MERLKGLERLEARAEKLRAKRAHSEEMLQQKMEKRRDIAKAGKLAQLQIETYWERSMGKFLWDLGFRPEHEDRLKNHIRQLAKKLFIYQDHDEVKTVTTLVVNGVADPSSIEGD